MTPLERTSCSGLDAEAFPQSRFVPVQGSQRRGGIRSYHREMLNNYWVYIVSSLGGRLYVGMTDDIELRMAEHKFGEVEGLASKYHCDRLVYLENFQSPEDALKREDKLKKMSRSRKVELVRSYNPRWEDLANDRDTLMACAFGRQEAVSLSLGPGMHGEGVAQRPWERVRRASRTSKRAILRRRPVTRFGGG